MAFRMRTTKFRHVYGEPHKKEKGYENVRLTRNAHDSNFCAVNPKFLAVVTESGGGGAFVVLPIEKTGRVDINAPKVCGHRGDVLDVKWSPFNDHVVASGSDDTTVKIWQIPETGLRTNLSEWQVDLHGHSRKVGYVEWHPTAENIILSAGQDCKCMIWNVEQAEPVNVVDCQSNIINSISWNRDGSLFCMTCKDKKLRIIDPRLGEPVAEAVDLYTANRPIKSVFLGDTGNIFTTGFNRGGMREIALWDSRNLSKELKRTSLDTSNGIVMPYYDHDTRIVFLAGKGDGNICYYELVEDSPYIHYLSNFGSSSPQRGLGVMPKRGCDPHKCEIMRFYKLHAAKNFVEPVSMIVPRKSDIFHEDIFPPTASAVPSLSADEWISGQNRDPILISLKDGHIVNDPLILPSKAVQKQDGALNQAPVITTYKAVNRESEQDREPQKASSTESVPSREEKRRSRNLASLKNIKQLSSSSDYVSLSPSKTIPPSEPLPEASTSKETDKDHAFVNDKIAAFENRRSTSSDDGVTSPTRRRMERKWSSNQDPPPDVIANGIKVNDTRRDLDHPLNVQNAASYFNHKDIEIIDIHKGDSIEKVNAENVSSERTPNKSLSVTERLILGDISQKSSPDGGNKVHVKKVWSPVQPPTSPAWQNSPDIPETDPELRKAYFRQVEEIKSLREQIGLKDKRIRQLEDEMVLLRRCGIKTQGESDC